MRTTSPHREYSHQNVLVVNESSVPLDSNLTVSTEHVVFSSFIAYTYGPLRIGVSLVSNSTRPMEDISVRFLDGTLLVSESQNITLPPHSVRRIVVRTPLPDRHKSMTTHNITVEVTGNDLTQPLKASATIVLLHGSWE